jgi:hypothetical protein
VQYQIRAELRGRNYQGTTIRTSDSHTGIDLKVRARQGSVQVRVFQDRNSGQDMLVVTLEPSGRIAYRGPVDGSLVTAVPEAP